MNFISRVFLFLIVSISPNFVSANEVIDLSKYEIRRIAQHGEDGILEKLFQLVGATSKYYVEFGAGDGHFCSNVKYLKEKYGWNGLLLDGGCSNNTADDLSINLHEEFITAENICELFEKYNVPSEFDLISIDIDRNDFYVWQALSNYYRPRVVVIEFNSGFNFDEDRVIKYSANEPWDGSSYSGSSMLALYNLGRSLGYSLIYQESEGVNLFFVRDDILESVDITFENINNVAKLYHATPYKFDLQKIGEIFTSSKELLKERSSI